MPNCAAGWKVEKETCVASAPPAPLTEAEAVPSPAAPVKKRFRVGRFIAGGSMFVGGYLISIAMAILGAAAPATSSSAPCWGQLASFGFIPIIGPGVGVLTQIGKPEISDSSSSSRTCEQGNQFIFMGIVAVVDTALQVAGIAIAATGFKRVEVPAEKADADRPDGVRLAISPGAPGSLLGLTLNVKW